MNHNTIWSQTKTLAEQTPASRNRYVDFLRAASIIIVILGHWIMAAPYLDGDQLKLADALHFAPWSQWLTWIFQVMPIFFIVGGYANAVSWEATCKKEENYQAWLYSRLKRLMTPVLPLVIVWVIIAITTYLLGINATLIKVGSQAAFIPTWFLAVYLLVIMATPITYTLWQRTGILSFWLLAIAAVIIDLIAFTTDFHLIRWFNYVFVWLGVHQLGYMWYHQHLGGVKKSLPWAIGGLATLVFLIFVADYPVSMITVPGEAISNSRPPTLALLALGTFHCGLILSIEVPMRRWLNRLIPWTVSVFINGVIMTLYLWHGTAMVLMIGLASVLGNIGFSIEPGTGLWWASRVLWVAILTIPLALFVMIFSRFERTKNKSFSIPPIWVSIVSALAFCAGIAILALTGIQFNNLLLSVIGLVFVIGGISLTIFSKQSPEKLIK